MADEIFELRREMNRAFGVTVVVVTHYPGVARHVGAGGAHPGRAASSAESFMQTTYRRTGDLVQQEYLVVDRVGRLQLPPDHVEQLRRSGLAGLAAADFGEGQVTLRPAGRPDAAPSPVQPQPEPSAVSEQALEQKTGPGGVSGSGSGNCGAGSAGSRPARYVSASGEKRVRK